MGFLDLALGITQGVLGAASSIDPTGLLGGVTASIGLGSPTAPLASGVGALTQLATIPQNLVETVLGVPQSILGGVLGGAPAIDTTGFGGGNGSVATRTVVETMDLKTGKVVRRKVMPGSPFLMNSEIKAAKKVFKQSAALAKRIPRKTVRESATTQLKNAAIDAAIRDAQGRDSTVVKC